MLSESKDHGGRAGQGLGEGKCIVGSAPRTAPASQRETMEAQTMYNRNLAEPRRAYCIVTQSCLRARVGLADRAPSPGDLTLGSHTLSPCSPGSLQPWSCDFFCFLPLAISRSRRELKDGNE